MRSLVLNTRFVYNNEHHGVPMSEALPDDFKRNVQFYKFCLYGFLKNLRFYEPFLMLFFLEKGLDFLQIGTLHAAREICINII